MRLQPKTFVYNWDSDDEVKLGFIAEDVAQVNPLFASFDEKGNAIGLSDRGLLAATVQAIKDQQGQIDELKLQLAAQGLINASTTMPIGDGGGFVAMIKNALNGLGLALQDGVASLKGVLADKITTKQMCVKGDDGEEVCLSKDELKNLLQKTGVSGTTITTYPPAGDSAPAAPQTEEAPPVSESPDAVQDNADEGEEIESEGDAQASSAPAAEIVEQISGEPLPSAEQSPAPVPTSEPPAMATPAAPVEPAPGAEQ